MNYGKDATEKKIKDASSRTRKYTSKLFYGFFKTFFLLVIIFAAIGTSVGIGMV